MGHREHEFASVSPAADEYRPAVQLAQVGGTAVVPDAVAYVPAAHAACLHDASPSSSWYSVPAAQSEQPAPSDDCPPCAPLLPAAHRMHDASAVWPTEVAYRPMGHMLHPVEESKPAALLYRPASQGVHVDAAVVDVAEAYLPGPHALETQLALPCSAW